MDQAKVMDQAKSSHKLTEQPVTSDNETTKTTTTTSTHPGTTASASAAAIKAETPPETDTTKPNEVAHDAPQLPPHSIKQEPQETTQHHEGGEPVVIHAQALHPPPHGGPFPYAHAQPPQHLDLGQLQYYQAQMRDHAAAYASAAAGAAWAAAQLAANVGVPPVPMMLPTFAPMPPPGSTLGYGHGPGPGPGGGMMYEQPPMMYQPPDHPNHMNMPPSPQYHIQQQQQSPYAYYSPDSYSNPPDDERNYYGRHRRKRQQRMPPSDGMEMMTMATNTNTTPRYPESSGPNNANTSLDASSCEREQQRRRKHKSRKSHNHNLANGGGGGCYYGSSSDDRGAGSNSGQTPHNKKKQRQPPSSSQQQQVANDESLLGKTGVSALYEWCGKRRRVPTFELLQTRRQDFETTVTIDTANPSTTTTTTTSSISSTCSTEWGRGRGRTKSAARQDAARKALQALLPGVVFDENSGVLVELPSPEPSPLEPPPDPYPVWMASSASASRNKRRTSSTAILLEELAPNLAKRLAIGKNDENDNDDDGKDEDCKKRKPKSDKHQVLHEDDDDYSDAKQKQRNPKLPKQQQQQQQVLVKWQHVYPGTSTTTSEEEDENVYYASRGASVCSSLLHAMVQIDEHIPDAPYYTFEVSTVPPTSANGHKRKAASSIVIHRGSFTCTATIKLVNKEANEETGYGLEDNNKQEEEERVEILQAIGVGSTKREARHIASAKLLALLFPDCDGMVQVKEAAEAARERYAASKALKQQQSKRERVFTDTTRRRDPKQTPPGSQNLSFAMALENTPVLPTHVIQHLQAALGRNSSHPTQTVALDVDGGTAKGKSPLPDQDEGCLARQWSRQKQLDDRLALALQTLNEHDEEGRSLPDELTVDDVGRTVLRKASPEDIGWIEKLLGGSNSTLSTPVSVLGQMEKTAKDSTPSSLALRLWSSSTIVLLLCRAIAPYEDPPLGCAVLTLGFSMQKGKLLRIAQIASEPHLPRERFIECLQSFATCMTCSLDTSMTNPKTLLQLKRDDLETIVDSHLTPATKSTATENNGESEEEVRQSVVHEMGRDSSEIVSRHLQSVLEESEGGEESETGKDKRNAKKEQDKPSKRSRVE
jgi:hypothetical protein